MVVQLGTGGAITQSFLIMPGDTLTAQLRGYVEGMIPHIITMPVTITAHPA